MNDFVRPDSPLATMGTVALWVGYVIAAYSAVTGIAGNVRHRQRWVVSSVYSLYAFSGLMVLGSALMIYGFLTHDFVVRYIALNSDSTMPIWYKLTAYWGSLEGSLMFWVAMLAVFSTIAVAVNRNRHRDMIGYVVGTIMVVQLFFLSILIYYKNPFRTFLTEPPLDGSGMEAVLQTYWMVIHPPTLYIGFVSATIPFAFGVAAMASGRLDDRWLSSVRVWTFICWFFLSLGLILGGRWAYEELGWGGYWAWDPVENSGLLAWFTATAFLHSVIIQEQRGMMKRWNLLLVITTFFLTIYGTFMTRSGIVQSVHAFGEDNKLAIYFVIFMVTTLVISFGLLLYRSPQLRSAGYLESFFSREVAFLFNNWILLACAVFVLFASMFPTISEAFASRRTVDAGFYNMWMPILGLALLFLAGAAPLLAYRRTSSSKLFSQFVFPVSTSVVVMVLLAVFVPNTRALTSLFSSDVKLPVALVNFGLVAFTMASIAQEFWRGGHVRGKQTGANWFIGAMGLLVHKQRKFGGYIVHLGMAVMFIGFGGKAWGVEKKATVKSFGEVVRVGDYEVKFLGFEEDSCSDGVDNDGDGAIDFPIDANEDGKPDKPGPYDAECIAPCEGCAPNAPPVRSNRSERGIVLTSERYSSTMAAFALSLDGTHLKTLLPELRKYNNRKQSTTHEVDVKTFIGFDPIGVDNLTRFGQDVYITLDRPEEIAGKRAASITVFINPLINFVWLGFAILAFGTVFCLFPMRWLSQLGTRSRVGTLGQGAVMLLVGAGLLFGMVAAARAQQGQDHEQTDTPVAFDHNAGNFRHVGRPETDTAEKVMLNLYCMCGCPAESLHSCKCGYAADERKYINALVNAELPQGEAAASQSERDAAYQRVVGVYVQRFGKAVILEPPSSSWLVPMLAIGGGLAVMMLAVWGWVSRSKSAPGPALGSLGLSSGERADSEAASENREKRRDYADQLDDELRDEE